MRHSNSTYRKRSCICSQCQSWIDHVMWCDRQEAKGWRNGGLIGSLTDWLAHQPIDSHWLTEWLCEMLWCSLLFADVVISWSHWFMIYCHTYLLLQYLLLRSTELLVSSWPDLLICCSPCLLISSCTVSDLPLIDLPIYFSTGFWWAELLFPDLLVYRPPISWTSVLMRLLCLLSTDLLITVCWFCWPPDLPKMILWSIDYIDYTDIIESENIPKRPLFSPNSLATLRGSYGTCRC